MKKLMLLAVMAVFVFTGAQAQKKPVKKASTKTESSVKKNDLPKVVGAGIVFETETMDYGSISKNANGVREFVFTNNGTEPLLIKSAQGSCGCTVPTYPKEPIAPGAQGKISVKYDTSRVGTFSKTVTLTTNAAEPSKVLTIKGTVLAEEAPSLQKS